MVSEPDMIEPLEAVTDARCASLPLTISFFQLDKIELHSLYQYL